MLSTKPVFSSRQLQSARDNARHSQQSLADKVGVSRNSIALYESGESVPGANILALIARELGQPCEFFFVDIDQNNGQVTARAV